MGNIVIVGVVLLIIVFAVRSMMKRGKSGCCGGGECAVSEVKDMHCENCKKKVENALNAVPGVWGTVNLKEKTAEVRMKEAHTELEIREWINKAGYGVSHVEMA